MNIIKHFSKTFFTISILVMYMFSLASPSFAAKLDSVLNLEIRTEKNSYELGEPVYLSLGLKNTSKESVMVLPDLSLESAFITIHVTMAKNKETSFLPIATDDVEVDKIKLQPGRSIHTLVPIFFGARGWTFDSAGKYSIRAEFRMNAANEKEALKSNAISFQVTDNKQGRMLLETSKDSVEAGKFLLWQQGDHLRRGLARLKEVLTADPKSTISSYINLAFAMNLSRPFRDYTIGRVRAAQPKKAQEYLNRIKPEHLAPYTQVQHSLAFVRISSLTGDQKTLELYSKRTRDLINLDPALQPFSQQLDQLK